MPLRKLKMQLHVQMICAFTRAQLIADDLPVHA